ncbi:MAG TPA: hypothetical protein VJH71_00375 [Candidatus Paceibacterota bacterium]
MVPKDFELSPYWVGISDAPGFDWEKFQDKIDKISEPLFFLLVDDETSGFISSIVQKYSQLSSKGSNLARLIRDVVIGDIFIGDLPQELSRSTGLDQSAAREIANTVVSQLFSPILDEIKKLQSDKFPGRATFKQQPTSIPQQNSHYQGEDLPESGGNIIDLRNK